MAGGGYDIGASASSSSPSASNLSSPFYVTGGGGGVGTINPKLIEYVVIGAVAFAGLIFVMLIFSRAPRA
jgi:hypothetical protein